MKTYAKKLLPDALEKLERLFAFDVPAYDIAEDEIPSNDTLTTVTENGSFPFDVSEEIIRTLAKEK
ncbi:MAG TPA: hypothetical protein VFB43_04050 [Terracidiphilus sp.]|nr:hypothetical protein [Terracidiphilus sp.]